MTTITTERLILRPFTETDLPEFMTIQQDPEVNRFFAVVYAQD
ncbi:GNAT family N-acetyltransferase [Lacticaseibacillus manihotivorans]|nr:GNAT family N-acetyltransferase [Lacticaseibacillus manihotivorans]